jgi:hypothetical protein
MEGFSFEERGNRKEERDLSEAEGDGFLAEKRSWRVAQIMRVVSWVPVPKARRASISIPKR